HVTGILGPAQHAVVGNVGPDEIPPGGKPGRPFAPDRARPQPLEPDIAGEQPLESRIENENAGPLDLTERHGLASLSARPSSPQRHERGPVWPSRQGRKAHCDISVTKLEM